MIRASPNFLSRKFHVNMFESGLPTPFLSMGDVECCISSQATNILERRGIESD